MQHKPMDQLWKMDPFEVITIMSGTAGRSNVGPMGAKRGSNGIGQ